MPLTVIRGLIDPLANVQSIAVPGFRRFLGAALVQGMNRQPGAAVFALGELDQPARLFSLRVFHTGTEIPESLAGDLEFIGSAVSREGNYAAHVFYVVRPLPVPEIGQVTLEIRPPGA